MKIGEVKIEELFAATDWCLRNSFPDDYDARCLYSACAIHTILKRKSVKTIIVGGNVGVFTLSADGREVLLEGFGGGDIAQPSHYWIEANGLILDLGVSYLPKRSHMSAVSMPMIAWMKNNPLPNYLQYIDKIRYAEEVEYIFPDDITNRVPEFIRRCEKRYASRTAKKKLPTWLLTNQKDLDKAARAFGRYSLTLAPVWGVKPLLP